MAKKKENKVYRVDENNQIVEEKIQPHKDKRVPRSRCFFIRTYINPNALKRFLRSAPYIQHWIYIVHDKDVHKTEERLGELKTPHTHLVIYLYEAKTVSAVQGLFDRYSLSLTEDGSMFEKTDVRITGDKVQVYRYLRHLDNPDRYQYGVDELVYDSWKYWSRFEYTEGMTSADRNIGLEILDDMNSGVDYYTLQQRYGDYFLKNVKNIEHIRMRCWQERAQVDFERDFAEILLNSAWYSVEQVEMFRNMLEFVNNAYISNTNRKLTFYLTAVNTSMEKFIQNHCITDGKKNQ